MPLATSWAVRSNARCRVHRGEFIRDGAGAAVGKREHIQVVERPRQHRRAGPAMVVDWPADGGSVCHLDFQTSQQCMHSGMHVREHTVSRSGRCRLCATHVGGLERPLGTGAEGLALERLAQRA